MQVKDIMTYGVVAVEPTITIIEACRKMKAENVGCLIIGDTDTFRGVVTQKDIIERALIESRDPNTTKVVEIMTDYVISCYLLDDLGETAKIMEKNEIRHIIVLDFESQPIATLSIDDFLIWGIVNDAFNQSYQPLVRRAV